LWSIGNVISETTENHSEDAADEAKSDRALQVLPESGKMKLGIQFLRLRVERTSAYQ
jgi:hypothetical protein